MQDNEPVFCTTI